MSSIYTLLSILFNFNLSHTLSHTKCTLPPILPAILTLSNTFLTILILKIREYLYCCLHQFIPEFDDLEPYFKRFMTPFMIA